MRMGTKDLSQLNAEVTFTIPAQLADTFQLCTCAFGLDPDAVIADYISHIVSVLISAGGDIFVEDCT